MEIAVLSGTTGEGLPQPFARAFGALKPDALVMLGPHDHAWRQEIGVGTVAGRVVVRSSEAVATDPVTSAREAVQRISSHASNWWLHTDLDVLDERDFSARGAPGELPLVGGLTGSSSRRSCRPRFAPAVAGARASLSTIQRSTPIAARPVASSGSLPTSHQIFRDGDRPYPWCPCVKRALRNYDRHSPPRRTQRTRRRKPKGTGPFLRVLLSSVVESLILKRALSERSTNYR
jgi:hypothetical protein